MKILLALSLLLSPAAASAAPVWYSDFEAGRAKADHNTIKIPAAGGTRFSLTDELSDEGAAFWRLRVGRRDGLHDVSFLAAPLTLESEGRFNRPVTFAGRTFAAGTAVRGEYRFNSYRVKYLREFRRTDKLLLRWGGALKMRHAGIKLSGGGQTAETNNTGFVPLAAFSAEWQAAPGWSLLFDLEGLASPQGRAEDALFAAVREIRPGLKARAGYRLLEGGSGAGEVYTFAYIHYFLAGLSLEF
jgi:hypothetical protein